jgi:hypothetical protein
MTVALTPEKLIISKGWMLGGSLVEYEPVGMYSLAADLA